MELDHYQEKVRLVAEAYAVLTPDQVIEMATSMDLSPTDLQRALNHNEIEWEQIKRRMKEDQAWKNSMLSSKA